MNSTNQNKRSDMKGNQESRGEKSGKEKTHIRKLKHTQVIWKNKIVTNIFPLMESYTDTEILNWKAHRKISVQ